MIRNRPPRRPIGAPENPVRTVRVSDETWKRAGDRARFEGVTMSAVLLSFVEGYALGKINPPRTQVVYDTEPAQMTAEG